MRVRSVQVRLERRELGVLLQHGVGVQLLVSRHRLDVDVDAVAKTTSARL
ncbi:MAG: hypothetical protein U0Q11_15280 [Vicinamibacterales bacterium]